ncbi:MAG: c-type cytochrome [Pirellulaceae bacterium]|nr:c-type cytochrome [Pirellulaceae bacterium]
MDGIPRTDSTCAQRNQFVDRRYTFLLCTIALAITSGLASSSVRAEEAHWIWASGSSIDRAIPPGQACLFRKPLNMRVESVGRIEIAADDDYELFINGNSIGKGGSPRKVDEYDITQHLQVGRNVIAVRVVNTHGETAALAARVSIKPNNADRWYTFSSDPSWRTSIDSHSMWESVVFNDRLWGSATSFGKFGETAPWDRDEEVASVTQTDQRERFQIQRGFGVQRVLDDDKVGSVIAMSFNEFGHILVSQEGGPLLLVYDRDEDGVPEHVRTYCDKVKSCQGILPLNGDVFVTGDGPDGAALYKLTDADRNGTLEKVQAIVKFKGNSGEHGPHGLRLGPDGMIYVAVGSHVQAAGERGIGDTYRDPYEGDLLPRYEDPGGHGIGIKAPGGTIIRTNTDGTVVERVAGGLRNAYDVIFNAEGGLFVHDADMEADTNTAWYRPTALMDVAEGGEFGWRTGWAKWPEHYLDRLPNLLDTGRGSPTGGVCYQHFMFPVRYQNTMFLADWSEGRILNVRLRPRGAGYVADSEVFLQGQPLNVTDIEVGPDGALYFCTGGRGTAGGVYRVIYKGEVPDRIKKLGSGIAAAVRQPQIESAWSRQAIAKIKRELGDQWSQLVAGVAYSDDNPANYRVRAMELMQLFGPVPSEELVLELSRAKNEQVRARAALLLALHPGSQTSDRLVEMLQDNDARVRRAACEAILRSDDIPATTEEIMPLLADEDRTLSFVARRVLERMPAKTFRDEVLNTADARVAICGMLALINADPTESTALEVLQRTSEMMTGFLSDADFIDALRLCQVALHRGKVDPSKVIALRDQIAEEFPASEGRMNHELIRLAAYLKADGVAERALQYIQSDAPKEDRTLVAMCLQFLSPNWTAAQRFQILKFYEEIASDTSSGSLPMYMTAVTRDFAKSLSADDAHAILEQGDVWRNAALAAIYKLKRPVDSDTAAKLRALDRKLIKDPRIGDTERRLRTGIIAMLATSNDKESSNYLRKLWRSEPERRGVIAMALAVQPEGENWDYLVRSLNILEDHTANEVVRALKSVPIATDDPMAIRQLILLGVRAEREDNGFEDVEKLLEHWTGMERPDGASDSMRPWQKWYAKMYPDRPAAELPKDDNSRWDFDQLVSYMNSDIGRFGDPIHGRSIFSKAQCASCHQFGDHGTRIGPDLSGIARRFTKREVVESILYPAHVVSDQYASKKVLTLDGRALLGLVSQKTNGDLAVRDAQNNVTIVPHNEIDQILPSTSSTMPSGLIDGLTLSEISDLMAYLGVLPPIEVATRPK